MLIRIPKVGDVYIIDYGNRHIRGMVVSVDEHASTAIVRINTLFGLFPETRVYSFHRLDKSHKISHSRIA